MTNVIARNSKLKEKTVSLFKSTFPAIMRFPIPESVHDVIVGVAQWREDLLGPKPSNKADGHVKSRDDHVTDKTEDGSAAEESPFLLSKSFESRLLGLVKFLGNGKCIRETFLPLCSDATISINESIIFDA